MVLQKAFDSVAWPYIFTLMEPWGFSQRFMGILHALYSSTKALLCLQGHYSKPLNIAKSTRQGCPLSPLIFAIAIESLAIAIRSNPNIQGVTCGSQTHKCGLLTNDIPLFITSPITTLPNLCKLLNDFAAISGLRVNYAKSQALNISLKPEMVTSLKISFKFEWSNSSIKYLGITLTAKIKHLYSSNFPLMYQKLDSDLKNWAQGELSWLGRIHFIKMTLLPRLLYLFRSLPINIRKDHLKSFQSKVNKFSWGGSGHRLPQKTLFQPRTRGGLDLPCLLWYFQAARIAQLSTVYSKLEKPDWAQIERQAVPANTLDYLLWVPSGDRPQILPPILSQTLTLWDKMRSKTSLTSECQTK